MSLWGNKETAPITGTIAIDQGERTVLGTGTNFVTQLKEGSFILIDGVKYKIYKITDATHLTLTSDFEASDATGKTIVESLMPTYLSIEEARQTVFVDMTESVVKDNKDKGITGAGWWLVKTYTAADGKVRYKSECLVSMAVPAATSGDLEDVVTADVEVTITINDQPNENIYYANETITLAIDATASSGSMTYQWQQKLPAEGSRWANIGGATSASYTTGTLAEEDNGTQFRAVLGTSSGSVKEYSNVYTAIYD